MTASKTTSGGPVSKFLRHHFRHFNAATLVDAADEYSRQIDKGNKMFVAMAGAMSTGELGISLAEMIRQDKVHAISCTGANLEEDVFNLVAHNHYKRIPNYRDLTPQQEKELWDAKLSRVTDTCIPEEEAMRRIDFAVLEVFKEVEARGESWLPHQFFYELIRSGRIKQHYQIDPKDSWMVAACEKNLPIYTPGWEDSTIGNTYASYLMLGKLKRSSIVRPGWESIAELAEWYQSTTKKTGVGFFQIGGGIAGDFPICVVPMIKLDLKQEVKPWSYFCQISDSTTSYGSYSGAIPNEKITWGKLTADTPSYVIESDASIVAPLIFASVLGL